MVPKATNKRIEKRIKTLKYLILIEAIAASFSTILAWYDIESIMTTGPIGSLIGFGVFIIAFQFKNIKVYRNLYVDGIVIGLSAPILSMVCFHLDQ